MSEPKIFHSPPAGLPGKVKYGGYAYIVEFDSGLLKVGMTQSPFNRVGLHVRNAALFGIQALRCWLSPLHETPAKTEVGLIAAANRLGTLSAGAEYFRGVAFDRLVAEADAIDFPPFDLAEAEERERQLKAQAMPLFGKISEAARAAVDDQTPPLPWPERAIADAFNRRGDAYPVPPLHTRQPIPEELIQRLADLKGVDVEDILDMTYIDMIEHIVLTEVGSEANRMRIYARNAGRTDMLATLREARDSDPWWPRGEE